MRRFSKGENHDTQTKMNVSVAFKLTLGRFFNSSVLLVLVSTIPRKWFDGGDLVYDATILIMMLVFMAPVTELFYIPGIMKWFQKRKQMALTEDGECQLTQREDNILCEGATIDAANVISNFMNMVLTCMFYAPIVP